MSLFQCATTRNGSRPPTCLGQCVYKGECWGPTVSDTVYFETPEAYIQLRSYSEPFLQMSDSSVFIQTSSEHPVVTCHPVNHRSHSTVTHTQTLTHSHSHTDRQETGGHVGENAHKEQENTHTPHKRHTSCCRTPPFWSVRAKTSVINISHTSVFLASHENIKIWEPLLFIQATRFYVL